MWVMRRMLDNRGRDALCCGLYRHKCWRLESKDFDIQTEENKKSETCTVVNEVQDVQNMEASTEEPQGTGPALRRSTRRRQTSARLAGYKLC
ncbi:hypothetical protein Tsubulata_044855 [Turnera subulata]|uniref:Uncharacterized protein n=1 Tax=Turnera subulata TaxID=218843 RepID=A0A9Q0JH76_9ROSI|nr:hypothetical protein Tsubulata_044855 [Turnera subulata]